MYSTASPVLVDKVQIRVKNVACSGAAYNYKDAAISEITIGGELCAPSKSLTDQGELTCENAISGSKVKIVFPTDSDGHSLA